MSGLSESVRESLFYHTRIRDWPESERPREKMILHGSPILSDAELIAILVGSGSGRVTALDVAKRMLMDHDGLINLSKCNLSELTRMKGIGRARACSLLAAFEIGRRIECHLPRRSVKITEPADCVRQYEAGLRAVKHEIFKVVLLDNANRIIRDIDITKGTLNASLVHPREVFKTAVDYLAAGVILMHNHPSGEAFPSEQDRQVTQQMVKAGLIIGIPVLDHIIVADRSHFSFANEGLL
ncbi:DNA repair protein RadC [bacterium]|nr:DNA repair protein RadC [bacterium]